MYVVGLRDIQEWKFFKHRKLNARHSQAAVAGATVVALRCENRCSSSQSLKVRQANASSTSEGSLGTGGNGSLWLLRFVQ